MSDELRARSLGLLARSLSEACPTSPPGSAAEPRLADRLCALCLLLASIRQSSAAAPPGDAAGSRRALDALAQLRDLEATAADLQRSGAGREVNHRFWRGHLDAEVAESSRGLVARWRSRLAGGPPPPRRGPAAAAEKRKREPWEAAWEAAWTEVAGARCAQAIELAAWSGLRGGPGGDSERAYRAKVRFLSTALRRPENSQLRLDVLEGRVPGQELVTKAEEGFLTEGQLAERQRHREEGLSSVCLRGQKLELFDAGLACPFCRASGARYAVLQDSFLVEGSSTYVNRKPRDASRRLLLECAACDERWQQEEGMPL